MNQIKKEMKRFLVAGISAVTTDLLLYYFLLTTTDHTTAKTISFIAGTIVAFMINKYWTFEKHKRSYTEIIKFILLYTTTLFANVYTNEIILNQFHMVLFAFFLATGVSTVLNFIGQKYWVFK